MFDLPYDHSPHDLRTLLLDELTIAVLAPHPDDFDAIGLTLRNFHRHGETIHLVVLSTGASGV